MKQLTFNNYSFWSFMGPEFYFPSWDGIDPNLTLLGLDSWNLAGFMVDYPCSWRKNPWQVSSND